MTDMQPISLVGAPVAPAANTGSTASAGGDSAGFAALLSGTALTPPATPGAAATTPAAPVFPMPTNNPLADGTALPGVNPAIATEGKAQAPATDTPVETGGTGAVVKTAALPDGQILAEGDAQAESPTPATPGKAKPTRAIDAAMPEKVLPSAVTKDAAPKPAAKSDGETPVVSAPAAPVAPTVDGARPQEKPAKNDDAAILAVAAPVQPMAATIVVAANPAAASTSGATQNGKGQKTTDAVAATPTVQTGEVDLANPEAGKKDAASFGESFEKLRHGGENKDIALRDPAAPAQRDQAAPRDFSAALNAARNPNVADTPRPADVKAAAQPGPVPQQQDQVVRASAIGQDMGIALSRHADSKGDQVVTLRLDPGHLGRIEVRLAMDDKGMMTARVAADHHHTLDLIRRDTDTLVRTLNDAGVRTDAQGFRFDGSMSGGQQQQAAWGGQQGGGQGRHTPFQSGPANASDDMNDPLLPGQIQSLGIASGRVDLLA